MRVRIPPPLRGPAPHYPQGRKEEGVGSRGYHSLLRGAAGRQESDLARVPCGSTPQAPRMKQLGPQPEFQERTLAWPVLPGGAKLLTLRVAVGSQGCTRTAGNRGSSPLRTPHLSRGQVVPAMLITSKTPVRSRVSAPGAEVRHGVSSSAPPSAERRKHQGRHRCGWCLHLSRTRVVRP